MKTTWRKMSKVWGMSFKHWVMGRVLVGVSQRLEIPREELDFRFEMCRYATEAIRCLLARKPWGFWVGDIKVYETFRGGANVRGDNAERAIGYGVEMEVWTFRPYYWVRVFFGKKGGGRV